VAALEGRGVGFRSLTEAIDTTTPGGRLVLHLFAALGQFERDLIRERTRARGSRPPRCAGSGAAANSSLRLRSCAEPRPGPSISSPIQTCWSIRRYPFPSGRCHRGAASRDIPLDKLRLSACNVRGIKAGVSIQELADDIARRSPLQSLTVRPVLDADGQETGMYEIPAGGRRYRTLELLVRQKRLAKTAPIPCAIRLDGIAEDLGHTATALSGPHPELESPRPKPPQPFSNGLLARVDSHGGKQHL